MFQSIEINMVVKSCAEAVDFYQKNFDAALEFQTELSLGENEAGITIAGMKFHLFDENMMMSAPREEEGQPIWWHILVTEAEKAFDSLVKAGCITVSPLTDMPEYGCKQAIVVDPYGYSWILTEAYRDLTPKEMQEMYKKAETKQ